MLRVPTSCHPRPSCSAHSLAVEEHPGLGSSRTGAGSSTAIEDSIGADLGRMMHHTGSGFLSSLLFAASAIRIWTLEQHNSAAFCSPPSASPSPSFLPNPPTPEKRSHVLGPLPCYPLQKEGRQIGSPGPHCAGHTLQNSAQAPAAVAGCHGPFWGSPWGQRDRWWRAAPPCPVPVHSLRVWGKHVLIA